MLLLQLPLHLVDFIVNVGTFKLGDIPKISKCDLLSCIYHPKSTDLRQIYTLLWSYGFGNNMRVTGGNEYMADAFLSNLGLIDKHLFIPSEVWCLIGMLWGFSDAFSKVPSTHNEQIIFSTQK